MEMKELRHMRAESLKTQGLVTSVIMGLLSGAAETTGNTVRAVQIIPGAITGAGKVVVNGTSSVIVGVGTEMMGLTNKVVNSTAMAAQKTGSIVTGVAAEGIKGTGKVVVGTGKLVVKGTTGVVKGTGKVMVKTGEVGMDVVKGTGNLMVKTGEVGMDVVKGTGKVMAKTGEVGMDVVKNTGNLMVGSTKAVAKGTGVLFAGAGRTSKAGLDMMVGSSRRISRMVSAGMDSSSNHGESPRKRISNFSFGAFMGMESSRMGSSRMDNSKMGTSRMDNSSHTGSDDKNNYNNAPQGRSSCPVTSPTRDTDKKEVPLPTAKLERQVSLDSGLERTVERMDTVIDMSSEMIEMQEFLEQLEGMDKHQVQEIIASEQAAKLARTSRQGATEVDDVIPDVLSFDGMDSDYANNDNDSDDEFMGSSPPSPRPAQHAVSASEVPPPTVTLSPRPPTISKRAVSAATSQGTSKSHMEGHPDGLGTQSMHTPRSDGR
jgi:hypothetical protein